TRAAARLGVLISDFGPTHQGPKLPRPARPSLAPMLVREQSQRAAAVLRKAHAVGEEQPNSEAPLGLIVALRACAGHAGCLLGGHEVARRWTVQLNSADQAMHTDFERPAGPGGEMQKNRLLKTRSCLDRQHRFFHW